MGQGCWLSNFYACFTCAWCRARAPMGIHGTLRRRKTDSRFDVYGIAIPASVLGKVNPTAPGVATASWRGERDVLWGRLAQTSCNLSSWSRPYIGSPSKSRPVKSPTGLSLTGITFTSYTTRSDAPLPKPLQGLAVTFWVARAAS